MKLKYSKKIYESVALFTTNLTGTDRVKTWDETLVAWAIAEPWDELSNLNNYTVEINVFLLC